MEATKFDSFIRRWGNLASLVRTPDGQLQLYNAGQPMFDTMLTEFSRVGSFDRAARGIKHPSFKRTLNVTNPQFWDYDEKDILNATKMDRAMEKFSWNPVTGEWLFVTPGQQHASARGKAKFDDYIRGIVLTRLKKVALRTWWPSWAAGSSNPYIDMDTAAYDLNYDGMEACETMLKAHGGQGWTFQFNIDNRQLQQLTGERRW